MEATLLRYFLNHSQSVVSTDQLLTEVWKRPDSSTRRVQEAIRRLRLQLEQQTPFIGIIENERGRGYRFIPAQQS
jgi:DNA-binding response OmpR family regulator